MKERDDNDDDDDDDDDDDGDRLIRLRYLAVDLLLSCYYLVVALL